MKILRKPVRAIIECPLCNCEFEISGKDWRVVEENLIRYMDYMVKCPNCKHRKKIIPGEVKCEK